MRIYLDLDTRKLMSSPIRALSKLEFKRRDNDTIELQFLRDGQVQELPSGTSARLGIKINANYNSEFLALTTLTKSGSGTSAIYGGELNLNTTSLEAAFVQEPVSFAAMLEVEWRTGSVVSSSQTLPVAIFNDVIRGDEGSPADLPLFYTSETALNKATQLDAEEATSNDRWMTPLRTKQAIQHLAATDWEGLREKPTSFPPSSHTHTLADISASGATLNQIPQWDGTAWAPVSVSGVTVEWGDLVGKPEVFPPSAHTHEISQINGLQTALNSKPTGLGGITAIQVVTSLPQNPSPTTFYIVTE